MRWLTPLLLVACTAADTDSDTDEPAGYAFLDDDPGTYAQRDRIGMPAINTAVITSKGAYNEASPSDDAAGVFVDEIVANLTAIHAALDDDLTGLGLVPCAVADCVAQAAPLVVPDVIAVDRRVPSGFPNGRRLEDPVIDVTLAVVLLDLSAEGQDATTLAGVPVNPPANDVAFSDDFPWLAPEHP